MPYQNQCDNCGRTIIGPYVTGDVQGCQDIFLYCSSLCAKQHESKYAELDTYPIQYATISDPFNSDPLSDD